MNKVKRTYCLGEEWLYYKIYCGVRIADRILAKEILELTQKLEELGVITQWFFIRYSDPDNHIRLRLKLRALVELSTVVDQVNQSFTPLLNDGLIWKVQTDTYVRELERYGSCTMEISETIFYEDSKLVAQTLDTIVEDELYFLFILRCVSQFLALFKLTDQMLLNFLEDNHNAYKEEFKVEKATKISIDKKYRGLQGQIELFITEAALAKKYTILDTILQDRNRNISKQVDQLLVLERSNSLEIELRDLLGSYVHMFVNRAFRDKQRFYEMLVYGFYRRIVINQQFIKVLD